MKPVQIIAPALVSVAFWVGWIVALPATWLNWPVKSISDDHWAMANTQGTIWQGSGQPAYFLGGQDVIVQTKLSWDFQTKELLKGRLTWRVNSDLNNGQVSLGWKGWSIQNVGLRLPVTALTELSPKWRTTGLSGWLNLNIANFSQYKQQYLGTLELQWAEAGSPLSQKQPFGSYQLLVQGDGPRLGLQLSTLSGPLMMDGMGRWDANSGLRMDVKASTDAENATPLKPLMLMLGRPVGENAVEWQIKPN